MTQAERISFQQRPVTCAKSAGSTSTGALSLSTSHQRAHSTCSRTRSVEGSGFRQWAVTTDPWATTRQDGPAS
ncbi:hypothetical protein [Streptomyces laurentii]|uniref:hypothetical protein n=1 Tax=Streptomyces laurentii TaxID=39478 RepID=UPI0036BEACB7